MVAATPSYRERMKAQRAAASAERKAQQAEWHRRLELSGEVRRLALNATKAAIRARGDKLQLYTAAQLKVMADAMIGPWLVEQARPGSLRHSTGYKLANDGHDTRSLAHHLGHRNLQSTARYTALAEGRFKGFWQD